MISAIDKLIYNFEDGVVTSEKIKSKNINSLSQRCAVPMNRH